jgi:hypothetical protein
MAKTEINPVVAIVAAIVLIGLVVFIGFRAAQPTAAPSGPYQPGVPPWLDKSNPDYAKSQAAGRPIAPGNGAAATGAAASHP